MRFHHLPHNLKCGIKLCLSFAVASLHNNIRRDRYFGLIYVRTSRRTEPSFTAWQNISGALDSASLLLVQKDCKGDCCCSNCSTEKANHFSTAGSLAYCRCRDGCSGRLRRLKCDETCVKSTSVINASKFTPLPSHLAQWPPQERCIAVALVIGNRRCSN
jgi:hypothetical protein